MNIVISYYYVLQLDVEKKINLISIVHEADSQHLSGHGD